MANPNPTDMKTHLINEYRRATAEVLGWKYTKDSKWMAHDKYGHRPVEFWEPDIDANQAMMVEDWLIEQGCWIEVKICKSFTRYFIFHHLENRWSEESDKSRLTAFAMAFMEYIKTNKT